MPERVRYLIDTNCCIFLFAGEYPALLSRVSATPVGEIGLSSIVFAELALGVRHGKPPLERQLEQLARQMPILPFDEAAARCYATLPFRRGRFDRLLGAHALSLGSTVITNNEADFADIPGLTIENWTL
ncbi:type II toxin-antitoxin system VapC family toxin [Sphingomonas parapaucimobilis]|uniref:type II toxin-antitoxin system VapC family toxin n=1 Tax=Sphingomonas parapaucimobilis TaxID=28213 RepID=UPI00391C8479